MSRFLGSRIYVLDWGFQPGTAPPTPPLAKAHPRERWAVVASKRGRALSWDAPGLRRNESVPVLSAASVTSITTTTARPRVTVTF
jgi:hypothetical protein